jgi:hypothetical protein
MKWLIVILLTASILLSVYAVSKTKAIESEAKPRMRLIANAG